MKTCITIFLLLTVLAHVSLAQECGPNCPVCSGAGSSEGALLPQKSVLLTGMSIPTADEETVVLNTRVGIMPWLDAGIGYAAETEKVLWNVRLQPILEQESGLRPALILGTGSVQIGGADQSAYFQLMKSINLSNSLGLRLSGGAATLLPDADEFYGLAGMTAVLSDRYALFANYDGESFHEGMSWIPVEWFTLSFLLIETKSPAISVSVKVI